MNLLALGPVQNYFLALSHTWLEVLLYFCSLVLSLQNCNSLTFCFTLAVSFTCLDGWGFMVRAAAFLPKYCTVHWIPPVMGEKNFSCGRPWYRNINISHWKHHRLISAKEQIPGKVLSMRIIEIIAKECF